MKVPPPTDNQNRFRRILGAAYKKGKQYLSNPKKIFIHVASGTLGFYLTTRYIGCSNNNNPEIIPGQSQAQKDEVKDNVPDINGIHLSNIDQALVKAKLGKIASVQIISGHNNPTPYYQIKLQSGNVQYLLAPKDEKGNERFIEGLRALPEKPIFISLPSGFSLSSALMYYILPLLVITITGYSLYKQTNGGSIMERRWKPAKSDTKFTDVKGYPQVIERLEKILRYIKDKDKNKVGAPMPKGILLKGPPGTGKTLIAKAIAGEAGIPLIALSGSEFVRMYVGVGAARVREAFNVAKKNAPCILFIDEIDALVTESEDDEYKQTTNQLLTEMDGFETSDGVTLIAATNHPERLPESFKRPGRIDLEIEIPIPITNEQREDILSLYIEEKREEGHLSDDIDIKKIAREAIGFSGAQLKNIVNRASLLAFENGQEKITMKNFDDAIIEIRLGEKLEIAIDPRDLWKTGVHEIDGHYIVAIACGLKTDRISMVPHGKSLGHVSIATGQMSEILPTREDLLKQLLVAMSGRAAEIELLAENQYTLGAMQDFKQARNLVRSMLSSAMLGPSYASDYTNSHSDANFLEQDIEIANRVIDNALRAATEIIRQMPKEKLEQIVRDSLQIGELTGEEANDFYLKYLDKDSGIDWSKIYDNIVLGFICNPTQEADKTTTEKAKASL